MLVPVLLGRVCVSRLMSAGDTAHVQVQSCWVGVKQREDVRWRSDPCAAERGAVCLVGRCCTTQRKDPDRVTCMVCPMPWAMA